MKIFEKIKEFFRRIKIKKLQEPKVPNKVLQTIDKNETDNLNHVRKIQNTELNKEQKLGLILKTIGCEQLSINKILESENIDIDNLRRNIQTLNTFKYSNIELSLILTNNIDVLTMQNEKLNKIINIFMDYYNNTDIIKELIYVNSKILSEEALKKFFKTKEIFYDYGISIIDDYDILIENTNVLFMNEIKLKESLKILKAYTKTIDKLKSLIRMEPLVVGITSTNLLSEYV